MAKYLLTALLLSALSGLSIAQTFVPAALDPERIITAIPSFSDPIVQLKRSDGTLVKNVRVPEDRITSYPTYDGQYLMVISQGAIHRINLETDAMTSIEVEMYLYNAEGVYQGANYMPLGLFTQGSDKVYLRKYEQEEKGLIDIYEVDFVAKSISKYMSVPVTFEKYSVGGSYYNKYLIVCDQPGKLSLYDIERKSLFKSLSFDLPAGWSDRSVDGYIQFLNGSELRYEIRNYGSLNPAHKAGFKLSYNLSTDEIMHQEFRTGEDAGTVYQFQPETGKLYWTRSINQGAITEWKKQLFDDEQLAHMIFEFTGVTWWNFDSRDPNLIQVKFNSGKIETYNISTQELISTENNGGGLNDF